jgi:amino-acid N-acetyltransferase
MWTPAADHRPDHGVSSAFGRIVAEKVCSPTAKDLLFGDLTVKTRAMIRAATTKDVRAIHALLQIYAERGELLARPMGQLYDHVRDFVVAVDEQSRKVIGCCALQICWQDLAEIRSLAVDPRHQHRGIGSQLTHHALEEARQFRLDKVFTLTYRPGFFEQFGFVRIDRAQLPRKIWADCVLCPKFPDCDETAMIKTLGRRS